MKEILSELKDFSKVLTGFLTEWRQKKNKENQTSGHNKRIVLINYGHLNMTQPSEHPQDAVLFENPIEWLDMSRNFVVLVRFP